MCDIKDKLSPFHRGQILTEGLILVREDICDWITTLFPDNVITGDNFLTSLHTGVLLCELVNKLYQHISPEMIPSHWPKKPPRPDRRATPLSFKARDNTSLFLSWCRSAGLRNTILFETKGLMNSDEEKNIVLTLLHLGEMCVEFNIPVPQFARFKKEIEVVQLNNDLHNSVYTLNELSDVGSIDSGFNSVRSLSVDNNLKSMSSIRRASSSKFSSDKTLNVMDSGINCTLQKRSSRIPQLIVSKNNIRALKNGSSRLNQSLNFRSKSINDLSTKKIGTTCTRNPCLSSIDVKVSEISKRCSCETRFKIERTTLHEGMYNIGSKNIFVRMFKGNVMLRIGGGWETLNEYLDKVDPCCKNKLRRKSTSNILESSITPENMSPKDFRKFSQSELTKVRKIKPIESSNSNK